jgi:hypothetical protein
VGLTEPPAPADAVGVPLLGLCIRQGVAAAGSADENIARLFSAALDAESTRYPEGSWSLKDFG